MVKSGWKCERCKYAGVIDYEAKADVYTVVELLANAHTTANSGTCADVATVRAWEIPATSGADHAV